MAEIDFEGKFGRKRGCIPQGCFRKQLGIECLTVDVVDSCFLLEGETLVQERVFGDHVDRSVERIQPIKC